MKVKAPNFLRVPRLLLALEPSNQARSLILSFPSSLANAYGAREREGRRERGGGV